MTNQASLEFFSYNAATGNLCLSYQENGKTVWLDARTEFNQNNAQNVVLLSMGGTGYGINEHGRLSPIPEVIKLYSPVLGISGNITCHHMGSYMQEFIDNYGDSDTLPLEIPICLNL